MKAALGAVAFAVLCTVSCGIPPGVGITDIIEIDLTTPASGVPGTVISAGLISVPVTRGLQFGGFHEEAELSSDLEPSTGKILIFALRDTTQPWLNCIGGSIDAGCTMLITGDEAVGGSILVRSLGRQIRLFLEGTFELGEAPAPGCTAYFVGGESLQWYVHLTEDLIPGSTVLIDLDMRRSEPPIVDIGWQLLLADPPVEVPDDQGTASCR